MAVPNFQQLMLPVLRATAARGGETHFGELEDVLAADLGLSDDDLARTVPSGQQTTFANRLNWAKAYMARAGLIEATRRGFFRVTQRGRALIAEGITEIDISILLRYPEFAAWRAQQKAADEAGAASGIESLASPEDQIFSSWERLQKELSRDLIARVHSFTPVFFERLIIDLLLRMGYGGGRADMARALGRSSDGGVDGVVKEDVLGLDILYVQAKRYAPERAVPVSEVRDFVGSLEAHRASKGVFVTTSYFPASAREFVGKVSKRVVLIDGEELASLMIRHQVGVRVKDVFEIKKIDEDYFVE